MKTKVSPAIVGAFVIGAFALGIVAVLTFGGVNFFSKPQRFIVYFDESIHGLDQGSPVKLRGVRVGKVAALNIRYDDAKNSSVAAVVCELNHDAVTGPTGEPVNVANRVELQALVDRGLRARLEVQSLATGLLFVGLDFADPKANPDPGVRDARYVVVPATQSAISEFQASITEILTNIKRTDFASLARTLNALAGDVRKQLESLDVKGAVEQWKKTGAQIEALAANPDYKRTLDNLNAAVTELRSTVAKLDAQVEPTGAQLRDTIAEAKKTIQTFNTTAASAQTFIANHSGLGDELAGTLGHLNEAADAVKRLADFLERNPNALITGKKKPQ
jgi:paraquat-inducible protein B